MKLSLVLVALVLLLAVVAALDVSLEPSRGKFRGTGKVTKRVRTKGSRRLRKGDDDHDHDHDEDEDEDDEDEDEFEAALSTRVKRFGRRKKRTIEEYTGFILNFDTSEYGAAAGQELCSATLTANITQVKNTPCTTAACIGIDVPSPPSEFFGRRQWTGKSDFDADGLAASTSIDFDEDAETMTISLSTSALPLSSESTQIRVIPTDLWKGAKLNRVKLTDFRLELTLSDSACVLTNDLPDLSSTAELSAVFDALPPSWITDDPDATDVCTAQPELCVWPTNGAASGFVTDGCLASMCSIAVIPSSGQFDGGFNFAGFLQDSRPIIMALRPQIRFAGLAAFVEEGPVPVPAGLAADGNALWNFDTQIFDTDGDLYPGTDAIHSVHYFLVFTHDGVTIEVDTDPSWEYLRGLGILPAPLVLAQSSANIGWTTADGVTFIPAAIGFDLEAGGEEMTIAIVAKSRADASELGRVEMTVVSVDEAFEQGGANCADPTIGCLPCSDPRAVDPSCAPTTT